jgi:hypothetical protein
MNNNQCLRAGHETSFEVIGFAENLQGPGIRLNDLSVNEARQAYEAAGEYLYNLICSDREVDAGDLLLYDMRTDRWATLRFVFADIVSVHRIADLS